MKSMVSHRVCLDREALAALRADGLGWGHDLECGCLRVPVDRRPGLLARLRVKLGGGV